MTTLVWVVCFEQVAVAQTAHCFAPEVLRFHLEQSYGEKILAVAVEPDSSLIIYVDPDDGSWTIGRIWNDRDIVCIIAAGEGFEPAVDRPPADPGSPT